MTSAAAQARIRGTLIRSRVAQTKMRQIWQTNRQIGVLRVTNSLIVVRLQL